MASQLRRGPKETVMWDVVTAVGIVVTVATGIPVFLQMRKHPKGMHILFFTEMWERFSYYGMRTILLAYMTQHFLFPDEQAQGQYGAYTSLVYLLPLIGGMLADKYLGTKKAIAFGALLLVAGHLSMAIEQAPARTVITYQGQDYQVESEGRQDQRRSWIIVDGQRFDMGPAEGGMEIKNLPAGASLPGILLKDDPETPEIEGYTQRAEGQQPVFMNIFFGALALIIMGVGFLKANISTIVGQLYAKNDPRRDAGFTLYYFGINLGAFWAQVLCAGIGAAYGWGWGFGLAGVGMLFGWLVFVRRRFLWFTPGPPQLPDEVGNPPEPEKLRKPILGPINREWLIYILALAGVGGVWLLVQREPIVNTALQIASAAILLYFLLYMIRKCTWVESQRMILALVLVAASVVFFTLFELAGSALNQFAERSTQLPNNGFFTVTSGQTQSFNGGFILIFAPLFAAMWSWLDRRKRDPGDAAKFALGLIQVGAGFLVLVWGAAYADASAKVPLIFLVLLYLLHTTGELFLSPVGLSAMTKLTPTAIASTMMATWFLGSSLAQSLQAQISKLTAQETVGGQVLDPQKALETYVAVFTQIGLVAIGIGVALGIMAPVLNRLAHTPEVEARPARFEPLGSGLLALGVLGSIVAYAYRAEITNAVANGAAMLEWTQLAMLFGGVGVVGLVLVILRFTRTPKGPAPQPAE
jgi:POT family proton-dependent oligopeptide transporter